MRTNLPVRSLNDTKPIKGEVLDNPEALIEKFRDAGPITINSSGPQLLQLLEHLRKPRPDLDIDISFREEIVREGILGTRVRVVQLCQVLIKTNKEYQEMIRTNKLSLWGYIKLRLLSKKK